MIENQWHKKAKNKAQTRHQHLIQVGLVGLMGVMGVSYYQLGGQNWLSIENVLAHRQQLEGFIAEYPIRSMLIFAASYILMIGFSLPGATLLTLVSGFLFGLWSGVLLVNISATIGSLLCFWMVRLAFAKWARQRIPPGFLEKVDQGLTKQGFYYMLFLRLVPAFPFFLINLGMAFTNISASRFFLGTMLGSLPGTIVYVNAGRSLGQIDSLSGLISAPVLGAFTLLGLFALLPVVYAAINARLQRKQKQKGKQ